MTDAPVIAGIVSFTVLAITGLLYRFDWSKLRKQTPKADDDLARRMAALKLDMTGLKLDIDLQIRELRQIVEAATGDAVAQVDRLTGKVEQHSQDFAEILKRVEDERSRLAMMMPAPSVARMR